MQVKDYEMTREDANSGVGWRTWLNATFAAIVTNNSGSEAPTTTYPFMWWYDTADETYYYLKQRNHDDSSWNTVFTYDVTAKQILNFATESYVDNLVDAINTALGTKADATAVNDALNTLDNNKADKATTLVGYGITDAYTKTESDAAIDALKDVAKNAKSAAYTLVLSDRGKSIDVSTGGITITVPLNSVIAFPIGAVVTITNTASSAITIASSAVIRQAGTTNTGSRTLAAYGMATLRKVGTDTWFISGAGLS